VIIDIEVTSVNYLCRVGLILIAAVVLVGPLTIARLSAQKDVETTSPIVGAWTLDKKLSDVADNRPRGAGEPPSLAVVAVAGSAGTDVVAGFPEVVADSGVGTRAIPKKSLAEWKRGETSSKRRIT